MKIMAKLLSVLLTVAMLFTLAACTVTPENPNDDPNNGNNGGQETDKKALYAELADKFVTGAFNQLETVKSIKFTLGGKLNLSEDYEGEENDFLYAQEVRAEFTVSEINGKLALYAYMTATEEVDEYTELPEGDEAAKWEYSVQEIILKDGVSYTRTYEYYDTDTDIEIEAMRAVSLWTVGVDENGITAMSFTDAATKAKEFFDESTLAELKKEVAKQLEENGTTDGKVNIVLDAAPYITDVLEYLKTVKNTDTVGKVLNDALKEIDPELTVEKIIAALLAFDTKTVNEAVAELEEYTVSEGLGTLQEMWDGFVASEAFVKLAELLNIPDEVKAEMIAFKISDVLAEYGEHTVADIIYTLVVMNSEPEYDSPAEEDGEEFDGEFEDIGSGQSTAVMEAPEGFMLGLVNEILPMLNTTFGDMGTDIYGFIEEAIGIKIDSDTAANKLALSVSAEFDTTSGAINDMSLSINVDLDTVANGDNGESELKGKANLTMNVDFALKEISGDAAVIDAPTNDMLKGDIYG